MRLGEAFGERKSKGATTAAATTTATTMTITTTTTTRSATSMTTTAPPTTATTTTTASTTKMKNQRSLREETHQFIWLVQIQYNDIECTTFRHKYIYIHIFI